MRLFFFYISQSWRVPHVNLIEHSIALFLRQSHVKSSQLRTRQGELYFLVEVHCVRGSLFGIPQVHLFDYTNEAHLWSTAHIFRLLLHVCVPVLFVCAQICFQVHAHIFACVSRWPSPPPSIISLFHARLVCTSEFPPLFCRLMAYCFISAMPYDSWP